MQGTQELLVAEIRVIPEPVEEVVAAVAVGLLQWASVGPHLLTL
jgi:hypothetical protein